MIRRLGAALLAVAAWAAPACAQTYVVPQMPVHSDLYMRENIMGAGLSEMDQIIAEQTAIKGALDGSFKPVSTYRPSAEVDAQFDAGMSKLLTDNAYPGGPSAAQAYVSQSHVAYEKAAQAAGQNPNSYATACGYFLSVAVTAELGRALQADQDRALRGLCVLNLAVMETIKKINTPEKLQTISDAFAVVGAMSHDELVKAKSEDERRRLKASLGGYYKQFFGTDLDPNFPIDNVACNGAKNEKQLAACRQVPNAQIAAAADNVK